MLGYQYRKNICVFFDREELSLDVATYENEVKKVLEGKILNLDDLEDFQRLVLIVGNFDHFGKDVLYTDNYRLFVPSDNYLEAFRNGIFKLKGEEYTLKLFDASSSELSKEQRLNYRLLSRMSRYHEVLESTRQKSQTRT